jgi:hypothetical protein
MRSALLGRILLLGSLLLFSPFGIAVAERSCGRAGTPSEAQALAEKAARHLTTVGLRQGFTDFLTPGAGFLPHDLYVFVFDRNGVMLLNARFPELIGSNIANARDERGRAFLLDAMREAEREGSAWAEYSWYNPCTGAVMPKSSHVIKVDDIFVGVGAYGLVSAEIGEDSTGEWDKTGKHRHC